MAMTPESGYTTPGQRMAGANTSTPAYTAYAASASAPTYAPPVSTPRITAGEELKWLDVELGTLHEMIRTLTARLEAVLTPPGPDADGGGKANSCASPLVDKLRDNRTSLESANHLLGRLVDRIEL